MARLRFLAVALLALAFAGSSTHRGRTQVETPIGALAGTLGKVKDAATDSCVIYSLTDMGYDADLGKWIARTVPEIVESSSWNGQGGMGTIRYYAPKNILIIKQTKPIQKKVDGFLKDLKTSMPKERVTSFASKKAPHAGVVPADYREPALLRASSPASEPSSYPVAAPVKQPKHLFHFIIRYEGDGIIDDNVVKFMKAQLQGAKSPVSVGSVAGAYVPGTPPPPPPGGSGLPPQPSYASPPGAVPSGDPIPSAAPTLPDGSPVPSDAPVPPSPAPKKKKEKKNEDKEKPGRTTVTPR